MYSASKAAVRSFARTWLVDLKDRNIRVNVISPDPVDTPALDPLGKEAKDSFEASIPPGRMGRPEGAKPRPFFLPRRSNFVNGIELFVDGGTSQI